jgi:hypothetical protein
MLFTHTTVDGQSEQTQMNLHGYSSIFMFVKYVYTHPSGCAVDETGRTGSGHTWIVMNSYEYSWIFMNIHVCSHTAQWVDSGSRLGAQWEDTHKYSWIFMNIHEYSWKFTHITVGGQSEQTGRTVMDTHEYSWVFMNIHVCSHTQQSVDSGRRQGAQGANTHEYSWIFMNIYEYSWIFIYVYTHHSGWTVGQTARTVSE